MAQRGGPPPAPVNRLVTKKQEPVQTGGESSSIIFSSYSLQTFLDIKTVKLRQVPKEEIVVRQAQGSSELVKSTEHVKPTVQHPYKGETSQVVLIITKTAWVAHEWLNENIKKVSNTIFFSFSFFFHLFFSIIFSFLFFFTSVYFILTHF